MTTPKIVEVKDPSKFTRSYGIIDYKAMVGTLKTGANAFVFDTKEVPLKPQTMWKAAKKLSAMVGKKVVSIHGKYQEDQSDAAAGYLFTVAETKN
jgi:hypothetical protein